MSDRAAVPILSYREHGDGLRVDLDRLIANKMLVQAQPGGGKSWAIRQIAEELFGVVPIIIIDPEGEFHTLREKFDFVLAAPHGADVEASPKTAAVLARRLVELRASCVIDIYELKPKDRRNFVRIFLETLIALPRELWHPTVIIIDEIHDFGPEKGHGEAESLDALVEFGSKSRKRGYCLVGATQRIAKFNKDVAASLNNKLIGATTLDVDQKRAASELGFSTKEQQASLRQLEPGTFYAYGPAISREITLVRTGKVKTTHPKAGETIAVAATQPSSKVKALIASSLADLPKEAEEEARTLEDLRKQNGDLQRRLREREIAKPTPVVDQRPHDREIGKRLASEWQRGHQVGAISTNEWARRELAKVQSQAMSVVATVERLTATMLANATAAQTELDSKQQALVSTPERTPAAAPRPRLPAAQSSPSTSSASAIGGTPQRILNALRFLETAGKSPAPRPAIAGLLGVSWDTGTFRTYLSELRGHGFIYDGADKAVGLTDAGRAQASDDGLPRSREELHEAWLSKLGGTPGRMLRVLLERYPAAVERMELGAACSVDASTGTFRTYLSELRSPGLIVDASKTAVRAADALFPEGL